MWLCTLIRRASHGHKAALCMARMGTGDKNVQRFDAVRETVRDKLFQRAVNGQGRTDPAGPQPIQNLIGGGRAVVKVEKVMYERGIVRQRRAVRFRHGSKPMVYCYDITSHHQHFASQKNS